MSPCFPLAFSIEQIATKKIHTAEMEAFPTLVSGAVGVVTLALFQKTVLSGKILSPRFLTVAGLALCLSAVFGSIGQQEIPVHSTGVVVVTGASSGIGRAAAIALTKKGCTVYAGVRKEKDADGIRSEKTLSSSQ